MTGLLQETVVEVPVEVEQIDTIIGWVKEGWWTTMTVYNPFTKQMCVGGMVGKVLYDDTYSWPYNDRLFKLIEDAAYGKHVPQVMALYNNSRRGPDEVVEWLQRAREAALAGSA